MTIIAERAGVAVGSIYNYFENKEVLIFELYQHLENKIYPVILDGYSLEKPIEERFIHLGTTLLRFFTDNPLVFRYIEQFFNSPYGVASRRDKLVEKRDDRNVYRELFEDGVSQQVMKNLPLPMLFALSIGPLFAAARNHILNFVMLDDILIARTIEACWDSVRI